MSYDNDLDGGFKVRLLDPNSGQVFQYSPHMTFAVCCWQGQSYTVLLPAGTCTCPAFTANPAFPCKHVIDCRQRIGERVVDEEARRAIRTAVDPLRARNNSYDYVCLTRPDEVPSGLAYLVGSVRLPAHVEELRAYIGSERKYLGKVARITDLRSCYSTLSGKSATAVAKALRQPNAAAYDQAEALRAVVAKHGSAVVDAHVLNQIENPAVFDQLLYCGYFHGHADRDFVRYASAAVGAAGIRMAVGEESDAAGEALLAIATRLAAIAEEEVTGNIVKQ